MTEKHITCRSSLLRRPTSRILAAVLVALASLVVPPARAGVSPREVDLKSCYLTVHFLKESDGARMHRQGWLPKGQIPAVFPAYGPGSASLLIWIFSCEQAAIDGRSVGSAMLGLTGIQIEDRIYAVAPTHWDQYLVWAHTDNAALGKVLRSARLPAFTVPHMRFNWRTNDEVTRATVPWGRSPFEVLVRGKIEDAPHLHDNTFQHGPRAGLGPRLELKVDPLVPRDRFCAQIVQPECSTITAKPGSRVARFLGGATQYLAADHDPILNAKINVVSE